MPRSCSCIRKSESSRQQTLVAMSIWHGTLEAEDGRSHVKRGGGGSVRPGKLRAGAARVASDFPKTMHEQKKIWL